jgi:methyl-accepting chemotaxis protein
MPKFDNQTIQLAIIAVAGLAVVLQAIILLAIYLSINKAARSVEKQIRDLRSSVMPIIYDSREFFTRVAPNVEATTIDVAEMVHRLRARSAEMDSTATEILGRLHRQTARLDAMLTGILDSADRVGGFMAEAVNRPARQLFGLLASIKAVVESLRASSPEPRRTHTSGDQDRFV